VLEVVVVFVRDMIARPALRERAYAFLPYLLTLFVFILALNLFGMIPLRTLTPLAGLPPIGGGSTTIVTVCAALAGTTLLAILGFGLWSAAVRCREQRGWPMPACVLISPVLWFASLSPPLPGLMGKIMLVPLALLELVGAVAKCFALMVRLVANMVAGHVLLAVLAMLGLMAVRQALGNAMFIGIGAVVIAASGLAQLLDLLVAGLQAYGFTLLTAMFLALYVEPEH
jgi:F-type H+-transporting ATPase subunit a